MFQKLCSIPITLTVHELLYLKAMWGFEVAKELNWIRNGGKLADRTRQSLKAKGMIYKPEDDVMLYITDVGREIMIGYVERLGL